MEEQDALLSPDEEVAMIFSSGRDDGASTSTQAVLPNIEAGSNQNDDEHIRQSPSQNRTIGSDRKPWDEVSESEYSSQSSPETSPKVFPTVEAYLASIPKYNAHEHSQIQEYMEIIGDNARHIRTDLPRSGFYTDEEMEELKRDFILQQLDSLIRGHLHDAAKEERRQNRKKLNGRLPLIKPVALRAVRYSDESE